MKHFRNSMVIFTALTGNCGAIAQTQTANQAFPNLPNGWSQWQVEAPESAPNWCCFEALGRTPSVCDLDSNRISFGQDSNSARPAESSNMSIYALIKDGKFQRLRVFGTDCPVKASSPISATPQIDTATSLQWLSRLSVSTSVKTEQLLPAMAMHRGAASTMFQLAQHDPAVRVREQSWFWLSQINAVGMETRAIEVLPSIVNSGEREQVIFALSQLRAPRGANALIQVIENTRFPMETRKKALFWLGQSEDDLGIQYLDRVLSSN